MNETINLDLDNEVKSLDDIFDDKFIESLSHNFGFIDDSSNSHTGNIDINNNKDEDMVKNINLRFNYSNHSNDSNDVTTNSNGNSNDVNEDMKCDICGKCFNKSWNLSRHIDSHLNLKKFECLYEGCNKKFNLKNKLQDHLRRHSNEKVFECSTCQKKFTDKSTLNKHMEVHQSNRVKYHCPLCNKSYIRPRMTKVHIKNVHLNNM